MRRQQAVRIAGDYWGLRQRIEETHRQGSMVKPATLKRIEDLKEQLRQFLAARFRKEYRLGGYLVRLTPMDGQGGQLEVFLAERPR